MKKKQIRPRRRAHVMAKECSFCKDKKEPTFKNVDGLQRFLTERGKIFARTQSGLCAMHQRHFEREVKYARHLALLPFTSRE